MNGKSNVLTLLPLGIVCLVLLVAGGYLLFGIEFRTHPAPEFSIGNNFDRTVTVFIEDRKMVKIGSGDNKKLYPYEAISTMKYGSPSGLKSDILVEIKSNTGEVLYSKLFPIEEAMEKMSGGKTFWIGNK